MWSDVCGVEWVWSDTAKWSGWVRDSDVVGMVGTDSHVIYYKVPVDVKLAIDNGGWSCCRLVACEQISGTWRRTVGSTNRGE